MFRFQSFEQKSFFWALLIATLGFVYLIRDFLQPIFWAALLGTLFYPLQQRLSRQWSGHVSISAGIVELLIVVSVIVPVVLVAIAVMHQSSDAIASVASGQGIDAQGPIDKVQRVLQPARHVLDRVGIDIDRIEDLVSSAVAATGKFIATHALAIGQNALLFAVQLMAMLYMLFFFLRDGGGLVERLIYVLPMGDDRERRLFAKFSQVANATVKGTLVVACVQGALGGIAFAVLGVPGAVLWGVVTTVLCIVPVFGAVLVWFPATIWLAASGEAGKAIGLLLFGVFVIGLIDNLLRPMLVGRDTRLPDYVVLVSTFGGIAVLGASGFVIGPLAAALCVTGWNMFADDISASKQKEQAPA